MGLFKRLAGLLGLAKEEEHQQQQQNDDGFTSPSTTSPAAAPYQNIPRKGFSVPVQVPVDRTAQPPLLLKCAAADGGIQGLRWYAKRLRIDEDGDIADEFLSEVAPHTSSGMEEQNRSSTRFEVKYNTRPAKVRNQALLPNGRILQEVECSQDAQYTSTRKTATEQGPETSCSVKANREIIVEMMEKNFYN